MINKKYENKLIDFTIKMELYRLLTYIHQHDSVNQKKLDVILKRDSIPIKIFYDFLYNLNFIKITKKHVIWCGNETDLANICFICHQAKEELKCDAF